MPRLPLSTVGLLDQMSDRPSIPIILRRILALAIPTFSVSAIQATGQLIEVSLVARQGTLALAGWAVLLPFALLLLMSAAAMGGGIVSAIARSLGAGRDKDASALVLHALVIAVAFSMLFVVVLAGFPFEVLSAIGGVEAASAAASCAVWMFGVGAVPTWLTTSLASVLRGGGKHRLASRVAVFAAVGQPPLTWLIMEPLGQGLTGLGMSFALCQWCTALAMLVVVARGGAGFAPVFRVAPRPALFGRILAVGAVALTMVSIANLTASMVTAQLAQHGPAAVAAFGISTRLEFMMIPLAFGVGSALTALVGRAAGAGDWVTARRTAWVGGVMVLCVCGSFGLSVAAFSSGVAGFFARDLDVVAIAAQALRVIGPAYGLFGFGMAMYFASLGAGRLAWPFAAALLRMGLAVGGGALLAGPLNLGLTGQFIGVALGLTAYGTVVAAAVRPGVWHER